MELFVGSHRDDALLHAYEWLGAASSQPLLRDVFSWCDSAPATWGKFVAFAEPDVPQFGAIETSNVDLVLAFSDRAIVCEVKSNRNFQTAKDLSFDSLRQCARHRNLVAANLNTCLENDAVIGIVFYPFLNPDQILQLRDRQAQTSYRHLTVCGGFRCRKRVAPTTQHPFDLLQVSQSRLGSAPSSSPNRYSLNAQDVLKQRLVVPGVRQYASLASARKDLQSIADVPKSVLLREWHIHGCRPKEQQELHEALCRFGFAEIVGAAGIGKSEFIREYLSWLEDQRQRRLSVARIEVKAGESLADVLRRLLEHFDHDPEQDPDDELLLRRLFDSDGLIWIQKYAADASSVIVDLISRIPSDRSTITARLIVESVVPTLPARRSRVSVGPLTNSEIYQILESRPSGHPEHDANKIAYETRGNPRLAIVRWQSTNVDAAPRSSTGAFEWVNYAFVGFERTILNYLVLVLSEAPLGMSRDLLTRISATVHAGTLMSTVADTVRVVIDKLEATQMIHVYRFTSGLVGPLGDAIGPDRQFIDINNVDVSLTQFIIRSIPQEVAIKWQSRTTEILVEQAVPGSLAEVTAALRMGELWPFCRSSFRHTHRGNLIPWLVAKAASNGSSMGTSPTAAYLERAIRLQHRMFQYPLEPVNLKSALGEPNAGSPEQLYMWQALSGRSNCYLVDGKCDVDQWWRDAAQVKDPDLAAQSLASLSRSLQLAQRFDDAWGLLRNLLAKTPEYTLATRGIVFFHVLSFLNRRKKAQAVPGLAAKTALQAEIAKVAQVALPLALDLENITYVASTVFFYVRSLELIDPPQSEAELALYLEALHFVERASPIRGLQAILTQGSLHRHYCFRSQQPLSWEEFVDHLDEAFLCNRRAFQTAINARNTTHQLNAASYCGELCLGSLPHVGSIDERNYISQRVAQTLEMYRYIWKYYPNRADVDGDSHIWDTLHHTYPLITLLALATKAAVTKDDCDEERELLGRTIATRWYAIQDLRYHDRPKGISELLRNIERTLKFARADPERFALLAVSFREPIERLCDETARFVQSDRSRKVGKNVTRLKDESERVRALLA
jgi:hypothetical protein